MKMLEIVKKEYLLPKYLAVSNASSIIMSEDSNMTITALSINLPTTANLDRASNNTVLPSTTPKH
jgi:hypothetical protein